jgi:4'-phosphopantetheinyl transferase
MHNYNVPVVLIHKIDFEVSEMIYSSLMNKIRESKRKKIERFKFREDALRSLFGETLLIYALEKYFDLDYEKEIITENEFGKPYLINKQISFNISHSGNWSVLVGFANDAGIDIEKIEEPPYEIMPKTFTQKEIDLIENIDPQVKGRQFYKMWTLKESYVKMIGQGLSLPLDSFSIDIEDENKIIVTDNNRQSTDVQLKLFYPDAEHIAAICLRNFYKEISPELVSLNDFLF